MRVRTILLTLLAAAAGTFACSASEGEDVDNGDNAITTTAKIKPVWKGPRPGKRDQPVTKQDIDAKLVLDAWKKVKETFYDNHGLKAYDAQGKLVDMAPGTYPAVTETSQCMGNSVPWWSDLALHFYCWQPSYAVATPNVRGCFSYVSRALQGPPAVAGQPVQPGFEQRFLLYPEIYDYCLFQPYDFAAVQSGPKRPNPIFDTAIIDQNKGLTNKVGVMKWTDDNIADAFKHVMFTWYEPRTYDFGQQQALINTFYGVTFSGPDVDPQGNVAYLNTDAVRVAECKAKRPVQALDPTDGTHCSKAKVLANAPLEPVKYDAAVSYMTNSVTTLPYTASSPTGGAVPPMPPAPPTTISGQLLQEAFTVVGRADVMKYCNVNADGALVVRGGPFATAKPKIYFAGRSGGYSGAELPFGSGDIKCTTICSGCANSSIGQLVYVMDGAIKSNTVSFGRK